MLHTTPRLHLCPLTPDDAEPFFRLNQDPEVLKYTGDVPFKSLAEARIFLENYDQYTRHKLGRMAMIRKADDVWLGWCGLRMDEETNEVDLGFRVFREHWGQSYATEAAKATMEYGQSLGIDRIIGRAVIHNSASIRILEKVGMKQISLMDFHGKPGVVYEWRKL